MPKRYRVPFHTGMNMLKATQTIPESEITHEFPGLRKDGSQFSAQVTIGTWKQGEKQYYVSSVRDITGLRDKEKSYPKGLF